MSSGFDHTFQQFVYLPSGGLYYPPEAFLKSITTQYLFYEIDHTSYNSLFESYCAVLNKYGILPTPLTNMLLSDFYYLWSLIYVSDINKKDEYVVNNICKCKYQTRVAIRFSKLKTRMINPFNNKIKTTVEITLDYDGMKLNLEFRRRLVKDNLEFGSLALSLKESNSKVALYISQQLVKMSINEVEIEKNRYLPIVSNLFEHQLISLYILIKTFNNQIGISNLVQYKCPKCGAINYCEVFGDIELSMFNEKLSKISVNEKVDIFRSYLFNAQYNIMTISEFLNVPLKDSEAFTEAFRQVEIRKNK